MFYLFAVLFYTWGILGGVFSQLMFALRQSNPGLIGFPGVEESSYQTATATTWIGGMVFFGTAALLCVANQFYQPYRPRPTRAAEEPEKPRPIGSWTHR
jgi:hypothetical protein